MSHRTDRYVLDILDSDRELNMPDGARKVLMAASLRANVKTSQTYTGEWLHRVAGLKSRSSMWRALTYLSRRGYIHVKHRDGKSSIVTFPVQGFVVEVEAPERGGRTDEGGQWHPAICACLECREATG